MRQIDRSILLGASLILAAIAVPGAQPLSDEFFEAKIRPVLAQKCYACHSSTLKDPKGALVLDTKAGMLDGGRQGPAIVPGKPADSRLLQALRYFDPHLQMPPGGKLADQVIADFERWIAAGAPDPRVDPIVTRGLPADAGTAKAGRRVVGENELAKGRQWWAFQAVHEWPAPVASHDSTIHTRLDHFVLAKLAEKGLMPSPEADPRTLVRRAYVDLIGL